MSQTTKQNVIVDGLAYTLHPDKTAVLNYENSQNPELKGTMRNVQIPIEELEIREIKHGPLTHYFVKYNGEELDCGLSKPESLVARVLDSPEIDLIIPETINYEGEEYTVTEVGDSAFRFCNAIKKVTLPKSIKRMQEYAFCGCGNLHSLVMHSDVFFGTYKPESVFSNTPITDIYYHVPIENARYMCRYMNALARVFEENTYVNVTPADPQDICLHIYEDSYIYSWYFTQLFEKCQLINDLKR